MNTLRGRIEEVPEFEGYGVLWLMVRGHVKKNEFIQEVEREYGLRLSEDDVIFTFARNTPVGVDRLGEMVINLTEPGRGAYPVTYVDVSEEW